MTTFRKGADGALRWYRGASKASERWGPNAKRPDFVEACQDLIIKKGMTGMIWDTLASDAHRPADLTDEEERYIVRCTLRREVELGRIHESKAAVVLRLIGGADHLRTENDKPEERRAVRAALLANPEASDRQLSRQVGLHRSIVAEIRKDLANN
jgi:hypothetical protein